MHRFFIDPSNIHDSQATLSGPESHHLHHVLRLTSGDVVELYDGSGNVYRATVKKSGKETELVIDTKQNFPIKEPKLYFAQGHLKGKKMDFLIQKATELGIVGFFPFYSAYCSVPPSKDMKSTRWEKITLEACKQCGRPVPLQIDPFQNFDKLLSAGSGYSCKLIFWEKETVTRLSTLPPFSSMSTIFAIIGPEGGFSEQEIAAARHAGFIPVSLGSLTLRAETASISAMAILQHLCNRI